MYKFNTHQFLKIRIAVLCALPLFISAVSFGQSNLTDGEIDYAVRVTSPGTFNQQTIRTLESGKLIYNFKNNLFRSEMQIGQTEHINVHDSKTNSGFSLIQGGKDKNYLVKMRPEDFEKEAEKFKGLTFSPQPETRDIAGYKCQKAIGKTESGNTFTVFYTKDLQPSYKDYNPRFKGLDGIPLQFEINISQSGATITATATKVNLEFQPSSLFRMPDSGFRVLTYQELQKLKGAE